MSDLASPVVIGLQPNGQWIAVFSDKELAHVSAFGDTPMQALHELLIVAALHITAYQETSDAQLKELAELRKALAEKEGQP